MKNALFNEHVLLAKKEKKERREKISALLLCLLWRPVHHETPLVEGGEGVLGNIFEEHSCHPRVQRGAELKRDLEINQAAIWGLLERPRVE